MARVEIPSKGNSGTASSADDPAPGAGPPFVRQSFLLRGPLGRTPHRAENLFGFVVLALRELFTQRRKERYRHEETCFEYCFVVSAFGFER